MAQDGLRLWKADGTPVNSFPGYTHTLAWSPNGDLLATTSNNGEVALRRPDGAGSNRSRRSAGSWPGVPTANSL